MSYLLRFIPVMQYVFNIIASIEHNRAGLQLKTGIPINIV